METPLAMLELYGYIALFPLAVIEGPIITIIGGFLSRIGVFNPFIVYSVVIAGDIVGDALFYSVGRYGKNVFLHWIGKHIGISEEKVLTLREHFTKHGFKTIIASKLLQGIGPVGLVAAGGAHIPYPRYMLMCIAVSLVQSAVFLGVGILFGHAYAQLDHYLNVFAVTGSAIVVFAIIIFLFRKLGKRAI